MQDQDHADKGVKETDGRHSNCRVSINLLANVRDVSLPHGIPDEYGENNASFIAAFSETKSMACSPSSAAAAWMHPH